MADTQVYADITAVAQAAADAVLRDLSAAIESFGTATWVIAGGTAPLLAYKLLASQAVESLDWSKVNIVIGDERCVPFDSPDSNWTRAYQTLLRSLPLSESVVRPPSDLPAEEAADAYDTYLRQLPLNDAGLPRFDHVWLGVGEDGHTLSLFPNHRSFESDGLAEDRLVIAVHDAPKPPPDRISLTFQALRGTANGLIITAGAGKAAAVSRALAGDTSLPVAQAVAVIEQAGGRVTWLLDQAAAA